MIERLPSLYMSYRSRLCVKKREASILIESLPSLDMNCKSKLHNNKERGLHYDREAAFSIYEL